MADRMDFPATVEEFMEQYKITDTEGVYTNGIELVPIFRMKQWFDRHPPADVVQVVRCKDCEWAMKSTELPGWYMCKCEEAFDYYAKPDDFCSHGKRKE